MPQVILARRPIHGCRFSVSDMNFQIYSGAVLIGSCDLDSLDPPMGIASGDFHPSAEYHRVHPVFRLYIEATVNGAISNSEKLERYYQERDDLDLTVRLPGGEVVPMQCVHIEDFLEELGEVGVTIAVPDSQTFAQYFEPKFCVPSAAFDVA